MPLSTLASELLADTSPLLSEPFPRHILRIDVPCLRDLFIASLLRVFELTTFAIVPSLNSPDALLGQVKCAVAELGGRVHVQVDTALGVFVQAFCFQSLVVLLLEVALHDAFVPTRGVCQDAQLLVHGHLLLKTIDTFLLHALEHFVGQVNFASTELFEILGCLLRACL